MSGPNRQKNPNQAQDEQSYHEEERSRRASLPTGQRRLSGAAPSIEDLRTQELMAATMLDQQASRASLPSFSAARAASMASNQMDASILARLAQQQQQHSLLERYQFQQHQQAAEQHVKAQQDEMEFNSLLLRKRQIDEMLLNSALSSRRLSMDSALPPSLYSHPGAAGMSNLPVQMGSAAAAAAMMGNAGAAGGASLGNRNISNRPIMGDTDALSGKISAAGLESGRAAFWAEQNRRYSDPQQAARMRMMMNTAPGLHISTATHNSGISQDLGGLEEEEDDETYFNDTGADEVDRDFKRSQENFPLKLYRIIYEVVKSGRGDVISFFPHGRAFAVHKPKEFISEIMPKYFNTGRMNTFLKQLNLYSFRRITEGRDKGGYFHPQFIHGKRHLCKQIKRKKTDSKPSVSKAKSLAVKGAGEAKEGERLNNPVSTEAYASSLSKKIQKQRQEEAKSPPDSPSSSRHPKMRWKNSQEGR